MYFRCRGGVQGHGEDMITPERDSLCDSAAGREPQKRHKIFVGILSLFVKA